MNPVQFRTTEPKMSTPKGMTVFNQNRVDTKSQPMFFGAPLGVQRYDSYKDRVFDKLTNQMLGYFWRPEEVSLQKDRGDYQTLRPEQKHIFTSNLKYQILLDSVQGRGPGMAFSPYCALPELEAAMNVWQFMERALRKILINYPKRQMGNKVYGGDSSHLPLKINSAGVIPAIFASALLLLPVTFSNFNASQNEIFQTIVSFFSQGQPLYMILYASGIIFFTFFYTSITFNPAETAENLRKYGGFIPGIRPGESTAIYIDNILTKLTTMGALYLTLVCLMPEFLIANYPIPFYLGGTSILIVVVVAIDTVTQIQTRLMSSQYEQLIKKTKFGR